MRRRRKYTAVEPTLDELIEEKMRILDDFLVVNRRNKKEIEARLRKAVLDNPNRDREIVLEQITNSLIMSK